MEVGPGIQNPGALCLTLEKLAMKKSLVALAAFAAVSAFPQSSVTLSGVIKGGLAETKYSNGPNTPAFPNGSGTSVADGSSRFLIGGTEDLGGGLKAVFRSTPVSALTTTVLLRRLLPTAHWLPAIPLSA